MDLSKIVEAILDQFRQRKPHRVVDAQITASVLTHGDARLLQVVLENLLNNAWKYTRKRSTAVIEFGVVEKQGQQVYYVRDNGAGFDMAYVDKIFGAFQRLHKEQDFVGTGIGLATVERIVHRHGGRIWAEGQVDQGATFYFTLAGES